MGVTGRCVLRNTEGHDINVLRNIEEFVVTNTPIQRQILSFCARNQCTGRSTSPQYVTDLNLVLKIGHHMLLSQHTVELVFFACIYISRAVQFVKIKPSKI